MTNTTHYNMTIAEGTDVVNPLTQIFPNFNTIDGAMNMYYDRHDISEPEFGWDSIGEIL